MCPWEPQPLPGILENLPPLSVPMPSERLTDITEALRELRDVHIPDWLDSGADIFELRTAFIILDTMGMLRDSIQRLLLNEALGA